MFIMKTSINDRQLKSLLKETVTEVIEERREIFYDIFSDVLEDIAILNAIKEGEKSKPVDKKKIIQNKGLTRMRSGSTTENNPDQSSLLLRACKIKRTTCSGGNGGMRNRITPH